MKRTRAHLLGAALASAACAPTAPVDLLRGPVPVEADVNGRGWDWIQREQGEPLRLNDVVRRTWPAAPPSRLRYRLDLPRHARLNFACGIPMEHHGRPGVEFVVKVVWDGRETVLWSTLLNPLGTPAHRRWLPAEVDLSPYAGRNVELVFETRGFEPSDDPRRAFWAGPVVTTKERAAPLAVVYLVDTLRADHTSLYGYGRDTTPELDVFARDAVVFDAAIAHSSWTKPAVASLMTSLLPARHRAVQLRDPLNTDLVTLAEMLHAQGFATGAAIANSVIYSKGSRFEQGFDIFAGLHGAENRASKLVGADVVVDAALEILDTRRGMPTFLYVHTMDPHVPYAPPPPFDRKYPPHPIPGHPGVDPRSDYKELLDRQRLIAQYDGSVAYGDQHFGRFVRGLKERGLYDDALLIFTADHGEEFHDHGKWLHGRSVFDELIRVPLVVKFPGGKHAGRRVAQQVQGIDVLPTVLESLDLPVPEPPVISGRPLQAVLERGAEERPALAAISHRGFVAHGVRTTHEKYVQRFSPEEDELYFDLQADPKEKVNRAAEAGTRLRALRARVQATLVTNPFRHVLRFVGAGRYALELTTHGWIEQVQTTALQEGEAATLHDKGRRLTLDLRPGSEGPREISFVVRPRGAVVRVAGQRAGRPLQARDVWIAREGVHPAGVPFALPDVEAEQDRVEDVFAAPAQAGPGLHLWLRVMPGHDAIPLDAETRARLKALGYLGE